MNKQYEENVVENFDKIMRKEFKRFKSLTCLIGISIIMILNLTYFFYHEILTEEFLRAKFKHINCIEQNKLS